MAIERPFRVPIGVAPDGSFVAANDIERGVPYLCPGCERRLNVRIGSVRRSHLAHRADANCSPETVLHAATKRRIAEAVTAWRDGDGPAPIVRHICARCHGLIDTPLRDAIVEARIEYRLPSGRVADVGLVDASGSARLAVEVFVTHLVLPDKEADLGEMPWIEITAEAVEESHIWPVRASGGRQRELACKGCAENKELLRQNQTRICAAFGVPEPGWPYVVVPTECWNNRCRAQTLCYFWPRMRDGAVAPEPRPAALKRRFWSGDRSANWVNACHACGAVVDDFYLWGIFFGHFGYDAMATGLYDEFFSQVAATAST